MDLLSIILAQTDHSFCEWLIAGMAVGITGLSGGVVMLFKMYRGVLLDRIKEADTINAILKGLHDTRHQ